MSVQQVKDRFQELAAYLGRDVVGLDKLRKLREAVNVLRTSLAAAQEQAAVCTNTRQLAVERALAAEASLGEATIELHALRQRVENLTRDLTSATKVANTEKEPEESDDKSGQLDRRTIRNVIVRLRRFLPHCPPISTGEGHLSKRYQTFNRESFASGWSQNALWILGASVALLCAFKGHVVIETDELFKDMDADEDHEGMGRNFIQWLKKSKTIDWDVKRDVHTGLVRLKNVKEGLAEQTVKEIEGENIVAAYSRVGKPARAV